MRHASLILAFVLAVVPAASARGDAPTPATAGEAAAPRVLETVVVSGVQPGPGLWKVTRGDHVMWVLGTLRPLPKRMQWESREVVEKVAQSQVLVLSAGAQVKFAGGALRGLFLLPSALKARNNPGDRTLAEVVPPALYARWKVLKQQYLPRNRSVEKRRPIVAAWKLYERAIERSGMSFKDVATPLVEKAAKKHDLEIVQPRVDVTIEEPKAAVKALRASTLDDLECFERTLTRLESDVETMKLRGNAWALGDVDALRELPYTDQNRACLDAVLEASVAAEHGLADLEARVDAAWLDAAEQALAKHRTSFAVLPVAEILDPEGYLETLRARGYAIEAPRARGVGTAARSP